jgi:hypothetical protein
MCGSLRGSCTTAKAQARQWGTQVKPAYTATGVERADNVRSSADFVTPAVCRGQIILREEAAWVLEHREWQEQFRRRTRKQYPPEFWDKSRRGKVGRGQGQGRGRGQGQGQGPGQGQSGSRLRAHERCGRIRLCSACVQVTAPSVAPSVSATHDSVALRSRLLPHTLVSGVTAVNLTVCVIMPPEEGRQPQLRASVQSESAEEAAMGWAPGPRITEADRIGDVRSLRRRLEDRLVLLVKGQGEPRCST